MLFQSTGMSSAGPTHIQGPWIWLTSALCKEGQFLITWHSFRVCDESVSRQVHFSSVHFWNTIWKHPVGCQECSKQSRSPERYMQMAIWRLSITSQNTQCLVKPFSHQVCLSKSRTPAQISPPKSLHQFCQCSFTHSWWAISLHCMQSTAVKLPQCCETQREKRISGVSVGAV